MRRKGGADNEKGASTRESTRRMRLFCVGCLPKLLPGHFRCGANRIALLPARDARKAQGFSLRPACAVKLRALAEIAAAYGVSLALFGETGHRKRGRGKARRNFCRRRIVYCKYVCTFVNRERFYCTGTEDECLSALFAFPIVPLSRRPLFRGLPRPLVGRSAKRFADEEACEAFRTILRVCAVTRYDSAARGLDIQLCLVTPRR